MKYHENDVYFSYASKPEDDYSIQGGSLVVGDLSITSGQDPQGKNRIGDVKIWELGRLRFTVGRKGSDTVAKWFKDRIPSKRNTFNSGPGELNFAFQGKYRFGAFGPGLPALGGAFEVRSVIFAQGHTLGSNNWWFGGSDCTYVGSNKVTCNVIRLVGLEGEVWTMDFQRGSNGDNTVEASNLKKKV
ncbi:hypothetical protein BKA70DRAFT_1242428 [Coprinopsis sp. MPI-PUGE-AT-0042]|nr:hypothetical protein BKA70DRAFT_1242428 [Coprinopsis sp. MPI-PUGE-AT-0042]